MRLPLFSFPLVCFFFSHTTFFGQGGLNRDADFAAAEPYLKAHIKEITDKRDTLEGTYGNPDKLRSLFVQKYKEFHGKDESMFSDSYVRWAWAEIREGFYSAHLVALEQTLEAGKIRGKICQQGLDEINRGMVEWRAYEPTIGEGMRKLIDTYLRADRGVTYGAQWETKLNAYYPKYEEARAKRHLFAASVGPCPPDESECANLRKEIAAVDKELAGLGPVADRATPEDEVKALNVLLGEVEEALSNTAGDAKAKQKKIDGIVEKIGKGQGYLKLAENPKINAIKENLKKVGDGVGTVAERLESVTEKITQVRGALSQIEQYYRASDSGSAADLVKAFQSCFDSLYKSIPIEIPGLTDFFEAYSQCIANIAESTGRIELVVRERNQLNRAYGSGVDLYIRPKGFREQRADLIVQRRKELDEKRLTLAKRLSDAGCNESSPCENSRADVAAAVNFVQSVVEGYTKKIAAAREQLQIIEGDRPTSTGMLGVFYQAATNEQKIRVIRDALPPRRAALRRTELKLDRNSNTPVTAAEVKELKASIAGMEDELRQLQSRNIDLGKIMAENRTTLRERWSGYLTRYEVACKELADLLKAKKQKAIETFTAEAKAKNWQEADYDCARTKYPEFFP